MASFSPTFIAGVFILAYLLSFVVFAIVRIATGISIQRLGYLSLRRIAYTPQEGIRINLRGLGFYLHRPTFAQPTWVSLRLTELKVTVDPKALGGGKDGAEGKATGDVRNREDASPQTDAKPPPHFKDHGPRSQTWKRLTRLKERIKKLHEKIHWLRMVDVVVLNASCVIENVGTIQLGTFSMAVDTRSNTVDRGRLFQHKKVPAGNQRPAEWIFVAKNLMFIPEGKEPLEILDNCTLNVHGLLYQNLAGLRDASVSLKLGRIHIPYDDFVACFTRYQYYREMYGHQEPKSHEADISLTDVMEELDMPGSREERIVQAVSDSKEFVSSILRGIQEIQLAISFIGMSKNVLSVRSTGSPLYMNVAMNEFGIDLHRLDPKSPAHRMYFSPKDIAHQALLAAISISISVDDGKGKPVRILYIPMATTTVKTTLPSKTVSSSEGEDAAERNNNRLFANLVVTSPSVDLDPKHLPLVLDLLQSRAKQRKESRATGHRQHLISRLLPKANIKVSVHEPVVRVALPPTDPALRDTDEYDLLILAVSSVSLDLESSHSSAGELHYALVSSLRVASHELYYHTAAALRYNLLLTDALELKLQLTASPEVRVNASGNLQTFSVHMVRPEISAGIRQIMEHFKGNTKSQALNSRETSPESSFLRRLPRWLIDVQLQGSNFGIELAGVDSDISHNTRGVALQLESWSAEYKIQRHDSTEGRPTRHRAASHSGKSDEPLLGNNSMPSSRMPIAKSTDGRRLAVHVRSFEGFVVEGIDSWESEPFLSVPRFEIALSTSNDNRGPINHLNSYLKELYLHYSLYRYYAIGVAALEVRKAFVFKTGAPLSTENELPAGVSSNVERQSRSREPPELFTIDVKAGLLQVKAAMPADPPLMLQVYGFEAGHHRWNVPFMRSRLIRLYAEAPSVKSAWARIIGIKNSRVDLRKSRRKHGKSYVEERSIDVSTDFVRVAVPRQLVPHQIFDNLVNVAKATQQLHHRFQTGTNEYVLRKEPEEPKKVPRISVRSKALMVELEDGAFDWKLGLIYRVGLLEQKHRLAREEAFRVKVKKLEDLDSRRASSRNRTRSTSRLRRGRSTHSDVSCEDKERSRSTERTRLPGFFSKSDTRGRHMRYDPEATCGFTSASHVSAKQAWYRLQEHNAQSWQKRINWAMQSQGRAMEEIRRMFGGNDELSETSDKPETILAMPRRPGLLSALISDLHVVIDKPSFPLKECPDFLHRVGKGMPYNTQYSLLIPMSLQIDMGEARITLRDYPLPLLHVPAIRPGQSPRLPSWSLKTDFVIAEEFRDHESIKHTEVEIVPAPKLNRPEVPGGFAVDVRRTVSPLKTYSDVEIAINTSGPTSITWGTSYQPAIQEMMTIIEGFSKPQVDPSDRPGFWDKIRLSVHSRVNVVWKGDGDVHLKLKGSRDPYVVTGYGAGFVMCWRNNVRWGIHQGDDPKKFMEVSSGEYVLAIPDYSHQARNSTDIAHQNDDSSSSSSGSKNRAIFKKVIMKLSGNVRWLAGLVFERNLDKGGRSFGFIPHYEVTMKNPKFAKAKDGLDYDAYRGFRSHHIHLSIAIVAPLDRDWSLKNLEPSANYNTVHLTPRFFTHFFDWWSLFSGVMSLPIRQGKLFPGLEKSSKKFGRHLATIKYNLLLSPLFVAHIYKHKDAEEWSENMVSATGLKLRLDSFMLDLHQRREEFAMPGKGRGKQAKSSGMRINEAQLDFISADVRAVSATIAGATAGDIKNATNEELAAYPQSATSIDMSRFTIPDNDFTWIDMDDFIELDWILPAESNPATKIMPLGYSPRFTYFRQTDHRDSISGDDTRSSQFGNEPTHYCIMSQDNDPRRVQCDLIQERLAKVNEQLNTHQRTMGEQELRVVRDGHSDASLKETLNMLNDQGKALEERRRFLQSMLTRILQRLDGNRRRTKSDAETSNQSPPTNRSSEESFESENERIEAAPLADFVSDFNNRFIVHNLQMKWDNSLRNIILRYVHQVSQRRGFVYYMSRRAVKFILDIVEEQNKGNHKPADEPHQETPPAHASPFFHNRGLEDDPCLEERIQQLLNDGKKFVNANDPDFAESTQMPTKDGLEQNIAEDFTPQNSYYVHLITPQIQMQSEKNAKSALIVTAKAMKLKVVQIMDKDRLADDVSGLVQRRFSLDMDSVQFFVSNQKGLKQYLHLYSANRYGTPKGSAWPPWVPVEVNFDSNLNPFGFHRVVQKTSASLRYDKYNTLRLKYNDEVTRGTIGHAHTPEEIENRIDHLWVEFPQIRAICDSSQYYAMYLIVVDLLLYNEPLEKVRSEKLEKIMLASDFSDLRGAPEMVIGLQERSRQLEEIKSHFHVHAEYLDRQGWQDRLAVEQDLASCEDELFFIMKAITTSQRKVDDRTQTTQSNGLLRWYLSASEIVWHLMREKNEPLMEIQLRNAAYDRTDNSDGSNNNSMEIERIHGLNLLPDALYPEMLAPFFEANKTSIESQDVKMFKVQWYMLEAIAGIPVLDQFEVNLFPLKIQLEREIGKKIFEYIFPGGSSSDSENGGISPFMVKHKQQAGKEDEESENEGQLSVPETPLSSRLQPGDSPDSTRAGSLELRLRPTLELPSHRGNNVSTASSKSKGFFGTSGEFGHRKLFNHSNQSQLSSRSTRTATGKPSRENLQAAIRTSNGGSSSNLSAMNGNADRSKRFALHRSASKESTVGKEKQSDDLSQMLSRASSYMTLAYVKIPSVVLCLSYKGRSERNIEDVHDFVFRMPALEYRNKTWSNLDLALRLKKDVIKALISHTGAIIGNKLSHHRPSKVQQSRLREIANVSSLLPNTNSLTNSFSDTSSLNNGSPREDSRDFSGRSYTSSQVSRSDSFASSMHSSVYRNGALVSEPASIPESEAEGDDNIHRFIHNTLTRRFTSDAQKSRQKESNGDDQEDSTRKKGVLQLGKKFLGSLN